MPYLLPETDEQVPKGMSEWQYARSSVRRSTRGRGAVWVEPRLEAAVSFAEVEGRLRAAKWRGLTVSAARDAPAHRSAPRLTARRDAS